MQIIKIYACVDLENNVQINYLLLKTEAWERNSDLMMVTKSNTLKLYQRVVKRELDFITAIFLLLLISPILLIITILIRITLGAPVIFRQNRPGYLGKPFTIYKFRTMSDKKDAEGRLLPDDQRITLVGRVLRSLSLDELPEIFNVLKGDLSFVGPRPLMMQYLERYSPEQARRHNVMPGITGWAQINGRNALDWEDKFLMDVWYVDHQSFLLDMRILIVTVWKVIRREGISQDGYVSASEFMGTTKCATTRTN